MALFQHEDAQIQHAVQQDFLEFAATLIQSSYRGYKLRKSYNVLKRQSKALQNAWRTRDEAKITRELAATILQRQWRSYAGRKTMEYYKNLIAMHEHHDPREILRMINPREAEIMDAAAGLHLRFRLGGECFPPRLLYKIFTHRPVTDICSFCPRDYNSQQTSRIDNAASQAPIFTTTQIGFAGLERKPYKPLFHFCSRERARQREVHRKQLQRKWRLAMYCDGALHDTGLGEEQASMEQDLMEWSGSLDFEQYATEWRSVATTLGSEAFVGTDMHLPSAPAWISSA